MSKNEENAIVVKNLSKSFRLPHEQSSGLKQSIVNFFKKKKGYEIQEVLKNISFEVKKGDFFGIVGRNGSGKSTLLKLLAGIYNTDEGSISINGSIIPFIELGVGFNPELTGRENIFLNGALLGFSRKEMEAMYDDIVEFAELEKIMDQKLKNYSSGMQVRLAFSIAIKAQGDILILDEVLAVGDEAFQRKCERYFKDIKKDKNKTVILVTHSMANVEKYCNKAMMLHDGQIKSMGNPEDVSNEYNLENLNIPLPIEDKEKENTKNDSVIKDLKVKILSNRQVSQNDNIEISVSYTVSNYVPTIIKLSLYDIDRNTPIFATASPIIQDQNVSMKLKTNFSSINDTNMKVSVSVRDKDYGILAFVPEKKSPLMSFKRTDYPNSKIKTTWAMLFDRGEWS